MPKRENGLKTNPALRLLYWGLVIAGIWFAYLNIQPYERAVSFLGAKATSSAFISLVASIPLLNGIAAIFSKSLSWILGAILWSVIQIIEILPLILYNNEKFIEKIVTEADGRSRYQEKDTDDPTLRILKRTYNHLPISVVSNLEVLKIFTYTVDFLITSSNSLQQSTFISQQSNSHSTELATTNTSSSVHNPTHIIDIVQEIASPIRNCIIFGIGGSGKGMLLANALRRIKAENPNRKIFYIDPKNEPSEYGYTECVVDVVRRKKCKDESPENICKWMDEVLDGTNEEIGYIEWANNQSESLLVIDEGSTLGDAAKKCRNERIGTLILHISSLGGSSKENVWLLAQSPYVGPLGLNLSATSQITAVAIISDKNTNVLKQWKKSPILEMIDLVQINTLIKASPCNRAVFFGGNSTWGAMPELPNYSALDRDNDKPT
ncbi:hypothetical protein [Nostoc sp.]|uniref:hypothetical protein n=1 Tax=Nostoc sp. TaxID=1180 RepID=UPI002FFB805B